MAGNGQTAIRCVDASTSKASGENIRKGDAQQKSVSRGRLVRALCCMRVAKWRRRSSACTKRRCFRAFSSPHVGLQQVISHLTPAHARLVGPSRLSRKIPDSPEVGPCILVKAAGRLQQKNSHVHAADARAAFIRRELTCQTVCLAGAFSLQPSSLRARMTATMIRISLAGICWHWCEAQSAHRSL